MSAYQLKIELLSDLCVSDGSVYNSSVDVDICHDTYGFPYIPAKRIRGCLRECALELAEWGMDISADKLFGVKGESKNRARVRIGDAHLEDYNNTVSFVRNHKDHNLFHPQNILSHYSYIRTQTGINYDTGTADDTSLRTIRVVNKGIIFCARVHIEDGEQNTILENQLKSCCAVFHSMGVARTRGLGELKATLDPVKQDQDASIDSDSSSGSHISHVEGADILYYDLELEEPVICKSLRGGEGRTQDYIEGSKMLGLVIGSAKKQHKDYHDLIDQGDLFCSNAYISEHGIRYKEVPAAYYAIKNDEKHYVNKLIGDSVPAGQELLQLNMMKHCYVTLDEKDHLHKKSVEIEERYHHRRPMDKGIGRASEEPGGDSQFYQISSIKAGQTFRGFFMGDKEQIKKIYEILSEGTEYHIGYSRSSEYGRVRLTITGMEGKPELVERKTDNFYIKLEAPVIVYGANAFYSTDVSDLMEEIIYSLKISKEDRKVVEEAFQKRDRNVGVQRYVRYTNTGGFNTTWNRPKPTVTAFDKGTVIHCRLSRKVRLHLPSGSDDSSVVLLGERISEGFGETSVHIIEGEDRSENMMDIFNEASGNQNHDIDVQNSAFAVDLCNDLFDQYLRFQAFADAKEDMPGKETRPTVSNMILMCHEYSDINEIEKNVNDRYGKDTDKKAKKLGYAKGFISRARKRLPQEEDRNQVKSKERDLIAEFCSKYHIKGYRKKAENRGLDLLRRDYLESYLTQAKYLIRQKEKEAQKGENDEQQS